MDTSEAKHCGAEFIAARMEHLPDDVERWLKDILEPGEYAAGFFYADILPDVDIRDLQTADGYRSLLSKGTPILRLLPADEFVVHFPHYDKEPSAPRRRFCWATTS